MFTNDIQKLSQAQEGVQYMRFTAFSPKLPEAKWAFSTFFGCEPEEDINRPHQRVLLSKSGSMVRRLEVYPMKIDFILTVEDNTQEDDYGFNAIPSGSENRKHFREAALRVLPLFESLSRVGVSERHLWHSENPIDAYILLEQKIPGLKIADGNASDFVYRINRPRVVDAPSPLKVNRLAEWARMRMQLQSFNETGLSILDLGEAGSVSTDVNTRAEDNVSAVVNVDFAILLEKLFALSAEIPHVGDVS